MLMEENVNSLHVELVKLTCPVMRVFCASLFLEAKFSFSMMWSRSTLKLLVFVLSAIKVHCYREEDEMCPRKEPPPGVLVLKIGSNVVLGCRGDVTVNDVQLVSATVVHKKHRNRSEVLNVGFTTQSNSVYVEDNSNLIKASATTGKNTKTDDSRIYTEPKENTTVTVKPSVTIREEHSPSRRVLRDIDQPTQSDGAGGARQEKAYAVTKGTNFFSEEDEYDDYDYDEERSRVTRGIKKRTRWTLNGRQVRLGVERGGILRLPHLSLANAGNYSCYRGDRLISTTNITVGASPERPTITCYRKTQTSKVRCDWTSKEPITPRPLCYLILKTRLGNVTRIQCSISSLRCWCAFPVEEGDKTLHRATLCVSNTVGSATSPEIPFTLQEILKPDPPTKVEVRPVEGRNNLLKVSWSYPRSWENSYYILHFHLRYRPQQAEKYQKVLIKDTLYRRLSFEISDALPHTVYEIQIQAKEEFEGRFSDWTDPVFEMTWSNNDIHIAPEITTTFESNSLGMFSEGSGGSGEGPGLDSVVIVGAVDSDAVWLCVSAVCGLCCFVALLMLTVNFFRHRLRFMFTIGKESLAFSSLPRSSPPLPPPALSVQLPEEGNSLMSPINHNQQRFLPDQQEEQEGIHLHNIDYFLTPGTEGVPLTVSSSLQDT